MIVSSKRSFVPWTSVKTSNLSKEISEVAHRRSFKNLKCGSFEVLECYQKCSLPLMFLESTNALPKKMMFYIKDFFSKCDQMRSFLHIWSHLLKKSLMENFIFCAVTRISCLWSIWLFLTWPISNYNAPFLCSLQSWEKLNQKQPSRGILRKSCSENIQTWVFSFKFSAYFQNTFS